MGALEASATGISTPPRAVPSSLVITTPVTPAVAVKAATCDRALRPTVASSTSKVSWG